MSCFAFVGSLSKARSAAERSMRSRTRRLLRTIVQVALDLAQRLSSAVTARHAEACSPATRCSSCSARNPPRQAEVHQ